MLREIFRLQNRWRFEEDFQFKLFERDAFTYIVEQISSKKIVGFVGSRQVGKTSLLYLVIQHLIKNNTSVDSIYYFNLDDLKLHELFEDIPSFLEFLERINSKNLFLLMKFNGLKIQVFFLKRSMIYIST